MIAKKGIYLQNLDEHNISPRYAEWLNDPEVNRFIESRFQTHSQEEVLKYVREINKSSTAFLFGIFHEETNSHIGNIKIGNISSCHGFGDVGLLIGEKKYWGKGYASEAITAVTDYAFETLNLHKLWAGIYAGNEASYKAFIRAGWKDVGMFTEHYRVEDAYVNAYLVEIINQNKQTLR